MSGLERIVIHLVYFQLGLLIIEKVTRYFFILFNNIMLQFFIQMRNRVNARDLFLVTVLEFTILTKYNTVTQNGFTAGAIFLWNYNFLKNCHFSLSLNKFFLIKLGGLGGDMDLFVQKFWGSICVCFMHNTVTVDRILSFRSSMF